MTKVMTFGTFDILHPGHEFYLKRARSFGDELVVVVALDDTVEKIKGARPKNDQDARRKKIEALDYVEKVILGNPEDKYMVIHEEKPDVIALGYDQRNFTGNLSSMLLMRGINAKIIRLRPFKEDIYKSSKMREKD